MGKRKAKLLQPKKTKLPKLDKEFECPFCSHLRSVLVKMDRGRGVACLSCRICGASFDKRINRLDEAVDVYGAWIDACVAANAQAAEQAKKRMASLIGGGGGAPAAAGDKNNSGIGGSATGAVDGGSVPAAADKAGRRGGAAATEGEAVGTATPVDGVQKSTANAAGHTAPRPAAGAAAWGGRHREAALPAGAVRDGEGELQGAESSSGRGGSSNRRLAGTGGGSGSTAAAAAAAAGGSRLRRLRLEWRQHDYSSSEEEDEADERFDYPAAASDEEAQSGSGNFTRKDERGDAGALDVLTRLREQQREEDEDDTEGAAGDLFGDDE